MNRGFLTFFFIGCRNGDGDVFIFDMFYGWYFPMMELICMGRVSLSFDLQLSIFRAMSTRLRETFYKDSSDRLMTTALVALSTRRNRNGPSAIGAILCRVSFSSFLPTQYVFETSCQRCA